MNTSIKVVLYTSKTLTTGEHPVMLRVIRDRQVKYLSTGISSTKENWNDEASLPKKSHPHYKEAKRSIAKKLHDAETTVYNLENDNKNLSAYEIKGKLKREKSNNPKFYGYFDKVIERFIASGQIKTAEIYKDTKRNLIYCTGIKEIHFSDIDISFLNKFEEYLKSKSKGGNTIYLYLRTLRAVLNKAIKEEICSDKYYPFKKFSLGKYSNLKTEKRAISKEDIDKIIALQPKTTNNILARNIFLFSYYCRGMNFVDIAILKWKDILDGRLVYTRSKTKEQFNIQILEPAIKILDHYKSIGQSKNDYVFPLLSTDHKTPQAIFNRKVKMLREINKNLKAVGKLAGIKSELTTYVARHSYATILKRKGVSTSLISEALGHDSEKTTQIYLDSFGNSTLDEVNKALL
jgi:integrase